MMSSSNGQSEGNQRSRSGCTNCRLRHLKCDNAQPSCTRCEKRGEKCVREVNVRFKHYSSTPSAAKSKRTAKQKAGHYTFPSDQIWCDSGDTLSFIDEGHSPQSIYDSRLESDLEEEEEEEEEDDASLPPIGDSVDFSSISINPSSASNHNDHVGINDAPSIGALSFSPISVLDRYVWSNSNRTQAERPPSSSGVATTPTLAGTNKDFPLYQEVSVFPLQDATEARLMRYFMDHVARRFDMCDPERHFAHVVPWRAAVCPPLMDAVFALSARYLSRTTGFDEFAADRYFQRCINSLVPMLSDPDVLLNQDMFAAVVVLRTLEEIEVPLSGADSRTHLFGSHLFVSASTGQSPSSSLEPLRRSPHLTGLRRAAFLVSFRQELYTAFVSQRPVIQAFLPYDIDRSVELPAGECTWTNKVLLHVADVLDFCFNTSSIATDISVQRYEDLVAYGESWYAKKPQSFSPIFVGSPDSETIDGSPKPRPISPQIWLLSDAVAAGLLNYHLSRILLLAFDPRTPRIGPTRTSYLKRQNNEIKQEVRTLIGMATGNLGCPPHFVWACMGITLGGDRFDERWEQEALLDVLKQTETMYAWSTSAAQQHLMEAWGWMDSDV